MLRLPSASESPLEQPRLTRTSFEQSSVSLGGAISRWRFAMRPERAPSKASNRWPAGASIPARRADLLGDDGPAPAALPRAPVSSEDHRTPRVFALMSGSRGAGRAVMASVSELTHPPLFRRHARRPRLTRLLDESTAQAILITAPAS